MNQKYSFFICYTHDSGRDFAIHLKRSLEKNKISAFIDDDLPKISQSEWEKSRDEALINSATLLLVITHGFEKSEEVVKEISLATNKGKKFMLLRYQNIDPNVIVDLKTNKVNLGKYNQLSFETKEGLIRQVLSNITTEETTSPYAFLIGENDENKNIGKTFQMNKEEEERMELLDSLNIGKLCISNNLLDTIYKQARQMATNRYHDAKLYDFSVQVFPFASSKVNIYMRFFSKSVDKRCSYVFSEEHPSVRYFPPDDTVEEYESREVYKTVPWKKNPNWAQFLSWAYAKEGPFASAIGTSFHIFADVSAEKHLGWRVILYDNHRGRKYRKNWNGKKLDEHNIISY